MKYLPNHFVKKAVLVCILLVAAALFGWLFHRRYEIVERAPQPVGAPVFPSVDFVLDSPIEIRGLNCDVISVDRAGNLYLANPRFMTTFLSSIAEGGAYLLEDKKISVHLIKSTRPSGTVSGPEITFVVQYETGELVSSKVIECEGETILMPESEQKKWGVVLASFLLTAQNLYAYVDGHPTMLAATPAPP